METKRRENFPSSITSAFELTANGRRGGLYLPVGCGNWLTFRFSGGSAEALHDSQDLGLREPICLPSICACYVSDVTWDHAMT